jgi:hypothetical protein
MSEPKTRILMAFACFLVSCANVGLRAEYLPLETLRYDAQKYSEAEAVVLYRADKKYLSNDNNERFTHTLHHEAVAVLKDSGKDVAEVSIPFWANSKVVALIARIIQPDGTVRELTNDLFLSENNGKGTNSINGRYFRFPDVRVGSILEYVSIVESPNVHGSGEQAPVGAHPVRQYVFELTASKPYVLEAKEYNSTYPIEVRSLVSGKHELFCDIRDLPRRKPEKFEPHPSFTNHRWAYRIVASKYTITYDYYRDWDDVVESTARELLKEPKTRAGFNLEIDEKNCDANCKVKRALDLVHAKVTNTEGDWDSNHALQDVLESGKGSLSDKANMLQTLLTSADVKAQLAFGTDSLSRMLDRDFPALSQLNHTFVFIPKQAEIAQDLYIDVTCLSCQPGQLRSRHSNIQVLHIDDINDDDAFVSWHLTPSNNRAEDSNFAWNHEFKIDESGSLLGRSALNETGLWAETMKDWRNRHTNEELRKDLEDTARNSLGQTRVQMARHSNCDAVDRCGLEFERTAENYAAKGPGALFVPLSALVTQFGHTFDEETRREDIHFGTEAYVIDEASEFVVPEGYVLKDAPATISAKTDGLVATFSFEKSPRGARVKRRIQVDLVPHRAAEYPDVQKVIKLFEEARSHVLTFEKVPRDSEN